MWKTAYSYPETDQDLGRIEGSWRKLICIRKWIYTSQKQRPFKVFVKKRTFDTCLPACSMFVFRHLVARRAREAYCGFLRREPALSTLTILRPLAQNARLLYPQQPYISPSAQPPQTTPVDNPKPALKQPSTCRSPPAQLQAKLLVGPLKNRLWRPSGLGGYYGRLKSYHVPTLRACF